MPDWEDKYAVPENVPGIAVDKNAEGASWEDKYLVPTDKAKANQPQKVNRKFGPLPGMSVSMSPERAESFDSAGRLGRDVGNSVALQALSAPGTLINMGGQGLYGAGSHIYDVAKEKGLSNVDADDLKHAAVKGGISALGPLIGRGVSPNVPMQPKGVMEGFAYDIAKKKGIDHVPEWMTEEIARNGRSDIFKPFVKELSHKPVHPLIQRIGEGVASNALPVSIGALAGHQFLDSPLLGAILGYGTAHARDIATKGIPTWYNNMAMHTGKVGPMFQSVLNQLSREGGDKVAEAIKY